jgi:cytochrome bd-type quinol oxidase subunit 2
LYFFLSSKEKFPKIGAYYSPLMSTLLLIVIVYDFSSCRQLSDIFSIRSAQRLVSWYTILVFAFLSGLIVLQLYIWATNRNKKNKAIVALKVIIGILYVIGCLVGVLANFEMLKKGKITYFAAFDLYSFVICGIMTAATAVKRCKSLRNPDAAIASL